MNSTDCSGATAERLRAISPMLGPRPRAFFSPRQDGGGSHRTTGLISRGWSRQGPGLLSPMPSAGWKTRFTAATTAVHNARRSAVILGFATAASLLAGAAAAWYA